MFDNFCLVFCWKFCCCRKQPLHFFNLQTLSFHSTGKALRRFRGVINERENHQTWKRWEPVLAKMLTAEHEIRNKINLVEITLVQEYCLNPVLLWKNTFQIVSINTSIGSSVAAIVRDPVHMLYFLLTWWLCWFLRQWAQWCVRGPAVIRWGFAARFKECW